MQGKKTEREGRKKKMTGGVMATGSEPESGPQKSNYRSSREGVGLVPGHGFKQHKALPDMYSQANTHKHMYTGFIYRSYVKIL